MPYRNVNLATWSKANAVVIPPSLKMDLCLTRRRRRSRSHGRDWWHVRQRRGDAVEVIQRFRKPGGDDFALFCNKILRAS